MEFVRAIEEALGKKAKIDYLPMQAGDVPATWADVDDLIADTGFKPAMSVKQGIQNFVDWYKEYYA
jgi:UDP-glucuronate 4-epimerase